MHKLILALLSTLLLFSCKSRKEFIHYYAYEDEDTNSYCTFEIRALENGHLKEVFYRATSDHYDDGKKGQYEWFEGFNDEPWTTYGCTNNLESKKDVLFLYISCFDGDSRYDEDTTLSSSIGINARFEARFLERYTGKNFSFCTMGRFDEEAKLNKVYDKDLSGDTYLIYYRESIDSLSLLFTKDMREEFEKEPCFKEMDLWWFPPYMKQVDKIEYEKFNLDVKTKYLKNPRDAPSLCNEKDRERAKRQRERTLEKRRKKREKKERKKEKQAKKEKKAEG